MPPYRTIPSNEEPKIRSFWDSQFFGNSDRIPRKQLLLFGRSQVCRFVYVPSLRGEYTENFCFVSYRS